MLSCVFFLALVASPGAATYPNPSTTHSEDTCIQAGRDFQGIRDPASVAGLCLLQVRATVAGGHSADTGSLVDPTELEVRTASASGQGANTGSHMDRTEAKQDAEPDAKQNAQQDIEKRAELGVTQQAERYAKRNVAKQGAKQEVAQEAAREATEYVPGTPGAPWTRNEVLVVKAKLWRLMSAVEWSTEGVNVCYELGKFECKWNHIERVAPKLIRLAFHDCLRYTDGSGGCDGCLMWDGIEVRSHDLQFPIAWNASRNRNAGLEQVVWFLEEIYTNVSFPLYTPRLSSSLRSRGKSRADLWALAAIVAVEFGIHINNNVCEDPDYEARYFGHNLDMNGGGAHHCLHRTADQCEVNLPRPFKFRTGRVDCASSDYKAPKVERHPSPQSNGQQTLEYFRQDFGFSGRETAAIMGAHTMGRFHWEFSLFSYVWVIHGGMMFNNEYFRMMVNKKDTRQIASHDKCHEQGLAYGERGSSRWVTKASGQTESGGPVFWIREQHICAAYCPSYPEHHCCKGVPEGAFCNPDNSRQNGSDPVAADSHVGDGCEAFASSVGFDEIMLNSDIGLYLDFPVDKGIPYGCPGYENFNNEKFKALWTYSYSQNTTSPWWSIQWRERIQPACPFNTMQIPAGSTPLHQVIEEYADSQQAWVNDFVHAFEKMQANGYDTAQDLQDGPDQWTNVICPNQDAFWGNRFWACWDPDDLSDPFYIVSALDKRVLQVNASSGVLEVWTRRPGLVKSQLWHSIEGGMLVNSNSNTLLKVSAFGVWSFSSPEGVGVLEAVHSATPMALDRSVGQHDGAAAYVYTTVPTAENHQWYKQRPGEADRCKRPGHWCTHWGSNFTDTEDCDGDGVPDPQCADSWGSTGFVGSATDCVSNWPSGKCAGS